MRQIIYSSKRLGPKRKKHIFLKKQRFFKIGSIVPEITAYEQTRNLQTLPFRNIKIKV